MKSQHALPNLLFSKQSYSHCSKLSSISECMMGSHLNSFSIPGERAAMWWKLEWGQTGEISIGMQENYVCGGG